jgi:hypothetical protein
MADRNTPASFTFEDFRVEFNELATDVGDINDLPTDVRSVAVSDLIEAVNEIVFHLNSAPTFSNESLIFEGTSPDDYETTLSVTNPTADRSIILPDASGDVVLDTATQTLTNKTIISPTFTGTVDVSSLIITSDTQDVTVSPSSDPIDVDFSSGTSFKLDKNTYTNSSITLLNGREGLMFSLAVVSNGSSYTFTNSNLYWSNSSAPTPSAIGKIDIYNFVMIDNDYYGAYSFNYG